MKKQFLLLSILSIATLSACVNKNESSSSYSSKQNSTTISFSSSLSSSISESFSSSSSSSKDSKSSNSRVSSSASSSQSSSSSASSSSSSASSSKSSSSSLNTQFNGWNVDITLRGTAFRDHLASLIIAKGNKKADYSEMIDIGANAAAYGGSGKFVPFYHDTTVLATKNKCNREHTWPNSRGGGTKNGGGAIETDPYCIRPTLESENSDRSNFFYGLNGKKNSEWDPASCGFEGARGESARVIFYIATKYGKSNNLSLTNNPDDNWNQVRTMGRLDRMVEWNKQYPVTAIEKQINNYLESQGYGRNPFVDYPELVDYIWTKDGIITNQANFYMNTGLAYQTIIDKCVYLPTSYRSQN